MMSKIFLLILIWVALISCDGGTSSNTDRRIENNSQIVEPTDDGTVAQINGATIRLDSDGNPTVIDDATGEVEATRNSDGTITVTSGDGSTVIFNPEDESVTNSNP